RTSFPTCSSRYSRSSRTSLTPPRPPATGSHRCSTAAASFRKHGSKGAGSMGVAIATPDLEPDLPDSRRRPSWRSVNFLPYALITPSVAVIGGVLAFPLAMLAWLSLQHYGLRELIAHQGDWVGLGNYQAILADPLFHQVIIRSLVYTLACVGLTVILCKLIALLLLKVRQAVRVLVMSSLVFVWATPVIVTVDIWQWMFDYEFGVINYVLTIYSYRESFGVTQYGLGAAIAVVMVLVLVIVTFFYVRETVKVAEIA